MSTNFWRGGRRREESDDVGSIPAWAGKPADHRLPILRQGVDPRVGGEA